MEFNTYTLNKKINVCMIYITYTIQTLFYTIDNIMDREREGEREREEKKKRKKERKRKSIR